MRNRKRKINSGVLDRDALDRGENDATGSGILPSHFAVIEQGATPSVSQENLEVRTRHRGVGADPQMNAEKLCETPSKSRASGCSEDRFDGEFRHTRLPRAGAKALDDNSVANSVEEPSDRSARAARAMTGVTLF